LSFSIEKIVPTRLNLKNKNALITGLQKYNNQRFVCVLPTSQDSGKSGRDEKASAELLCKYFSLQVLEQIDFADLALKQSMQSIMMAVN